MLKFDFLRNFYEWAGIFWKFPNDVLCLLLVKDLRNEFFCVKWDTSITMTGLVTVDIEKYSKFYSFTIYDGILSISAFFEMFQASTVDFLSFYVNEYIWYSE